MTENTKRRDRYLQMYDLPPERLTFRRFVDSMRMRFIRESDHHWRPQVDFLIYNKYDDVFCLEEYFEMKNRLSERIGLIIYDTRKCIKHGLDNFELMTASFADTPVTELAEMRSKGQSPDHKSLFDEAIRQRVARIYAADLAIHRKHFPTADRLFDD